MSDDVLKMLTTGEIKLLQYFKKKGLKEAYEEEIVKETGLELSEVSRSALWLENKGLAKRIEEKVKGYELTDKGKKYIGGELPEEALLKYLKEKLEIRLDELYGSGLMEKKELEAAIGYLIRNKLARIHKGEAKKILKLTENGKGTVTTETQTAFNYIVNGEWGKIDKKVLEELQRRGLVREILISKWKVQLTEKGIEKLSKEIEKLEVIDKLTPDIIVSREWERKPIRWYDVSSPLPKTWGGRKHPLRLIMEKIRDIFIEMGFREMEGPWVEVSFWNMDSMFIPQDHPAREMQATFYMNRPSRGQINDRELVEMVKKLQENGFDTGSIGWQQPWSEDEAMRILLRTHTTAVTFRVLGKLIKTGKIKPPVKFFAIGRVFRNEAIDWKHLAEFHQVEGFVVAENLTLRSLMGYIKEFYSKMGIHKLRFKPTYNPYTEPSMEIFAWHKKVKKWVEVGNSGLFRPETLRPYNINTNVIAWGLAVERLASIVYEIGDIRKLVGPMVDVDWVRGYRIPVIKF
ncbi:MAG: phenylalanine--tRNA ligase subunit alpha [Candidatus Njordarchaeia archaeon]